MGQQQGEGEILSLTSIRGIAAFWVVVLHCWPALLVVAPEALPLEPLVSAGLFAVPLFFILSGYVLGLRYLAKLSSPTAGSVVKFWWLRLGRVYPVHAFTLLASLALVARNGWPTDEGHSVGSFVANCFLTHAWNYSFQLSWNYPAWSISSEWFAYLIFPLAAVPLARAGRRSAACLLVLAAAASAGVYAFEDHLIFKGLAVVVPTFIGGMTLAILFPPSQTAPSSWTRVWTEIILFAIAMAPVLIAAGPALSALLLLLFFGLVAALGFNGNQGRTFWRSGLLVYLGEISYSLYMTHAITITLLTRFVPFDFFAGQSVIVRLGFVLGCLGVILGTATVVYYSVERPLRNLSRRWLAPTKKTPVLQSVASQCPAVEQETSCAS